VTPRGEHFLESLERGMAVLACFDAAHPTRTLTEVAGATGLTKATARRILLTLADLGYVRLDGRSFTLAPRVLDFGFSYLANLGTAGAEPVMRELSVELGQSVLLAVLDGTDVRYVARANAPRTLHLNIPVGERSPAQVTSSGRLLVASLPDADRERWLSTVELVAFTRHSVSDVDVLRDELTRTRQQHWAHSASELDVGMEGVAVLVPGSPVATALSVVFPATRYTAEDQVTEVVPLLTRYASRIAEATRTP